MDTYIHWTAIGLASWSTYRTPRYNPRARLWHGGLCLGVVLRPSRLPFKWFLAEFLQADGFSNAQPTVLEQRRGKICLTEWHRNLAIVNNSISSACKMCMCNILAFHFNDMFWNRYEGFAAVRIWRHWSWWDDVSRYSKNTSHYAGSRQADRGHVWTHQGIFKYSVSFICSANWFQPWFNFFLFSKLQILLLTYCRIWIFVNVYFHFLLYQWCTDSLKTHVTVLHLKFCKYELCLYRVMEVQMVRWMWPCSGSTRTCLQHQQTEQSDRWDVSLGALCYLTIHMDTHLNGHFPGNPALVVSPSIFLFHLFWICALLQHHFTMSFLDVPSFLSVGKLFLIVYVCSRSVAWCIGQGNGLVIEMLQVQLLAVLLPGNDAVLVVNKQCNLVGTKLHCRMMKMLLSLM